ncbi:hypothetical protein M0813_24030 [Anaeramoeba flamelloides]|uniref:Uncharacterized protein n=1 Tax=Anaeramoeba flamelloides TaxID=1746091 RepID=A0ABQ8Y708_9EUKA|nr:hypothetical protein M0813_24030 [Anaeramoeba flamelloides]
MTEPQLSSKLSELPNLELIKEQFKEFKNFNSRLTGMILLCPQSFVGLKPQFLQKEWINSYKKGRIVTHFNQIKILRQSVLDMAILTGKGQRSIERGITMFFKRSYNFDNINPYGKHWFIFGSASHKKEVKKKIIKKKIHKPKKQTKNKESKEQKKQTKNNFGVDAQKPGIEQQNAQQFTMQIVCDLDQKITKESPERGRGKKFVSRQLKAKRKDKQNPKFINSELTKTNTKNTRSFHKKCENMANQGTRKRTKHVNSQANEFPKKRKLLNQNFQNSSDLEQPILQPFFQRSSYTQLFKNNDLDMNTNFDLPQITTLPSSTLLFHEGINDDYLNRFPNFFPKQQNWFADNYYHYQIDEFIHHFDFVESRNVILQSWFI